MKNPISFLILLLFSVTCFSQSIVPRTNSSYTVMDARFKAQYNLFVPTYADTLAALSGTNEGIDSLGAVIFTYDNMSLMVRSGSPKVWTAVGSGGGSSSLFPTSGTGTATGAVIADLDGNNLLIDDIGLFSVDRSSISRLYVSATQTLIASPDGFGGSVDVTNSGVAINGSTTVSSLAGNGPGIIAVDNDGILSFTTSAANLIVQPFGTGTAVLVPENDTLYHRTIVAGTGMTIDTIVGTRELIVATTAMLSLNGLTNQTQTFATPGSTGTSPAWASAAGVHTLNLPLAGSSVTSGMVSNGTQTFAGTKTLSGITVLSGGFGSSTSTSISNLFVAGGGAIGSLSSTAAFIVEGAAGTMARVSSLGTTSTTLNGNTNYGGFAIAQMGFTEASSGTHPLASALIIRAPVGTNAGATTTNLATVYIEGEITGVTPTAGSYSLWIKSGDLMMSNGDLSLGTAGNKINIATGSNASVGSSVLVSGTVTVSTTAVTASSKIFLSTGVTGGTVGHLSVGTITAGTSFVINSTSATETSTINWWIVN